MTPRYARSQAITTIDDTGSLWFSKNQLIAKAFSKYDPKRKMTIGEISLDGSCAEAFLGFTHEVYRDATFGRIFRFEPARTEPVRTERIYCLSGSALCGSHSRRAKPS